MNKISCFLPYAGKEQVEKTVNSLQATGLIEEIRLITTDTTLESLPGCEILFVDMPYSSATLKLLLIQPKENTHCFIPKRLRSKWVCLHWNV